MVPLPTLCLWPPHFVIEHSLAASSSRCYYCLYISNCTLCVWVCLVRLINLFFFAGILLLFFDLLFIMYVASFLGFFFCFVSRLCLRFALFMCVCLFMKFLLRSLVFRWRVAVSVSVEVAVCAGAGLGQSQASAESIVEPVYQAPGSYDHIYTYVHTSLCIRVCTCV